MTHARTDGIFPALLATVGLAQAHLNKLFMHLRSQLT